MRTRIVIGKIGVATLALVLSVLPTAAGKADNENTVCPPIAGIIEGPDPIPTRCLDELIDASEDTDAAQSPDDGQVVVWADPVGQDHDIALREWTEEGWGPTQYLTSALVDEREPDLFFESDGTLYLTWTRHGDTPQVLFTRRDPLTGSWSADVVVADNARRPAIVARDGRAVLAFERLRDGEVHELVIALQRFDGAFDLRVVARTRGVESLDPVLSSDATGLWIAWRSAGAGYGVRGLDTTGHWTATGYIPAGVASNPASALRGVRLSPQDRSRRRD